MRAAAIAFPAENLVGRERSLKAFLLEKERRSGSQRAVEGYSRMSGGLVGRGRCRSARTSCPGPCRPSCTWWS